jgi:hypothetical protein
MRKSYPSREKDRWDHALIRPLNRVPFEMVELMRADLFELLDVLTTGPCSPGSRAHVDADIQAVADRLKEMTPYRARALSAAMKDGRIEWVDPDDEPPPKLPSCGPIMSPLLWDELYKQLEHTQR